MIVDTLENYTTYFKTEAWEEIFQFLKGLNKDSQEKSNVLRGKDLFINVDGYTTKTAEEAVLETHVKYVDIQLLLAGEEFIDVYPAEGLVVKDKYDVDRDVAFYEVPEKGAVRVKLTPGNFTVLFPQDAHMPQLQVAESVNVKKVVVKVIPELLGLD